MTQAEFHALLTTASDLAIETARSMVVQPLPSGRRYHILLNQSADHHATADEVLYPAETRKEFARLSQDDVVTLLTREGRCPAWIDINVKAVSATFTLLELSCCGRFTADSSKLYYVKEGRGPFGVKSPNLPLRWRAGTKFSLKAI